jgi:hypothetical protein
VAFFVCEKYFFVFWGKQKVLLNESDFPKVLKALFLQDNIKDINIYISPHERERAEFLSDVCESYTISNVEMLSVLNWKKVIETSLFYKSKYTYLKDGKADILIEGKGYRVSVENNIPVVEETDGKQGIALSHKQAEKMFFGLNTLVFNDEGLKNWCPLPFHLDRADMY